MFSLVTQQRRSTRERRSCLPFQVEPCVKSFSPITSRKSLASSESVKPKINEAKLSPRRQPVTNQETSTSENLKDNHLKRT